jgi:hypothetical protein
MIDTNHSPNASGTGFNIRNRKKNAKTTRRMTMIILYGLIFADLIGIFRERGCLASSILLGKNMKQMKYIFRDKKA